MLLRRTSISRRVIMRCHADLIWSIMVILRSNHVWFLPHFQVCRFGIKIDHAFQTAEVGSSAPCKQEKILRHTDLVPARINTARWRKEVLSHCPLRVESQPEQHELPQVMPSSGLSCPVVFCMIYRVKKLLYNAAANAIATCRCCKRPLLLRETFSGARTRAVWQSRSCSCDLVFSSKRLTYCNVEAVSRQSERYIGRGKRGATLIIVLSSHGSDADILALAAGTF